MLVLSRKIGETLMIGDNIEIINLGMRGNKIRIGINAPRNITIHRQEVYQKINSRKKDKAK